MQKKNIYLIAIVILLVIILGGAYVMLHVKKPNAVSQSATTQKTDNPEDTILLATHESLKIFTDSKGITLYHGIQDLPRNAKPPYNPYTKCTGSCSVTWPPFYTDNIKISPPLKSGDFKVFTRPDGKKQLAYRGWPLYYYAGDSKPGDINGQGVENTWYAGISPE